MLPGVGGCVCVCVCVCVLSPVRLFVAPWIVAPQAPLSVEFPRQESWSRLPFPSLGELLDPGMEPVSPALAGKFFTIEPPGKPTRAFPSSQLLLTFNKVRRAVKADNFFLFFISTYLARNSCVCVCAGGWVGWWGALGRMTEEVKEIIIQFFFLPYSPFSVPSPISYSCFSLSSSHSLLPHFSSSSSSFFPTPLSNFFFLSAFSLTIFLCLLKI